MNNPETRTEYAVAKRQLDKLIADIDKIETSGHYILSEKVRVYDNPKCETKLSVVVEVTPWGYYIVSPYFRSTQWNGERTLLPSEFCEEYEGRWLSSRLGTPVRMRLCPGIKDLCW